MVLVAPNVKGAEVDVDKGFAPRANEKVDVAVVELDVARPLKIEPLPAPRLRLLLLLSDSALSDSGALPKRKGVALAPVSLLADASLLASSAFPKTNDAALAPVSLCAGAAVGAEADVSAEDTL